jgi:hypothetical protein
MAILNHRRSLHAFHTRAIGNALLSDPAPTDSSNEGTSSILIAGVVIIAICVAMLLAGLIGYWYKRRAAKKRAANSVDETSSQ